MGSPTTIISTAIAKIENLIAGAPAGWPIEHADARTTVSVPSRAQRTAGSGDPGHDRERGHKERQPADGEQVETAEISMLPPVAND